MPFRFDDVPIRAGCLTLNSHWLRTLRPRNLKPAAATTTILPPQHMRHCVESAGEPGDTILA